MAIASLMGNLKYEAVLPDDYGPHAPQITPAVRYPATVRRGLIGGQNLRSSDLPMRSTYGSAEPGKSAKGSSLTGKSIKSTDDSGTETSFRVTPKEESEYLYSGAGPDSAIGFYDVEAVGAAAAAAGAEASLKPDGILTLEKILSEAYGRNVSITRVRELPVTRKPVKEVYFLINNALSKVWVFKADPKRTAEELRAYFVAYRNGVPTGRPIGYNPKIGQDEEYPFDVAILGGVVEHAGDPYDQLLRNMELRPDLMFQTAAAIVGMIADYQIRLTRALKELQGYNLNLEQNHPRKEIKERMLAALGVGEEDAEGLIRSCEDLAERQGHGSGSVVSHGDVHTGNIVTIAGISNVTGQMATSVKKFGIIDWGSIGLDFPYSDVVNFWLHHQRQARNVCKGYDYNLENLLEIYQQKFNSLARREGGDGVEVIRDSRENMLIQLALWNIYEMFDPTRKNKADIERKARTHFSGSWKNLEGLQEMGSREAVRVKGELVILIGKTPFRYILKS